eukprot:3798276-Rhodomonas_salina.1
MHSRKERENELGARAVLALARLLADSWLRKRSAAKAVEREELRHGQQPEHCRRKLAVKASRVKDAQLRGRHVLE